MTTAYSNNTLQLPRVEQNIVRLNNLLLNKTMGYTMPIADEKLLRFRLAPGILSNQAACPVNLTLELGNTIAGLWLSDWPLVERIRQFLPENLLKKLPENLAISVIENALESIIQYAEQGLGLKIAIQSTSAEAESSLYSMPLGFEMQIADQATSDVQFQGEGLLILDPQLYPHIQERLSFWPSEINTDWEQHATLLRIEISRTTFTMQEINQLQPFDLILLEDTRFHTEGAVRLYLDSAYCCEAMFNSPTKNYLTIKTDWTPMSDNEQKQAIEHISQIPVQLSFDLGQKTLSFNEVRQIRPGYVLELSTNLPEVVQIRSQNRLIGTGELVEINGRIGVRVLNLFTKKAKGA